MRQSRLAPIVALVVLSAVSVVAKGPTVILTVSGGALPQPIDVTAPGALVHVWSDDLLGARASAPDANVARYEVAFHVLPNRSREARVMYVVSYAVDEHGNGFVRLPGRGEPYAALNASTIERSTGWYRARQPWSDALRHHLP
jgi:hypothetical protein